MKNYTPPKTKAQARDHIIDIVNKYRDKPISWAEYAEITAHIEYIARRFGLVKEFRENGVI